MSLGVFSIIGKSLRRISIVVVWILKCPLRVSCVEDLLPNVLFRSWAFVKCFDHEEFDLISESIC
jgi:hypothetical protein